ncbi:MAG: hypothetical protein RLZ98_285 [Pseudomonadota bacterium]
MTDKTAVQKCLILSLATALVLAGCAQGNITTGSVETKPEAAKRGTPVVAGREARMYVMAGFKEKDCSALTPDVKVTTAPAKGEVTFKPGQQTLVQSSISGSCVGKQIAGTGIYYTARKGETGADTFTITATAGSGQPITKSFSIEVVE